MGYGGQETPPAENEDRFDDLVLPHISSYPHLSQSGPPVHDESGPMR
jgi:hypothetical protein